MGRVSGRGNAFSGLCLPAGGSVDWEKLRRDDALISFARDGGGTVLFLHVDCFRPHGTNNYTYFRTLLRFSTNVYTYSYANREGTSTA